MRCYLNIIHVEALSYPSLRKTGCEILMGWSSFFWCSRNSGFGYSGFAGPIRSLVVLLTDPSNSQSPVSAGSARPLGVSPAGSPRCGRGPRGLGIHRLTEVRLTEVRLRKAASGKPPQESRLRKAASGKPPQESRLRKAASGKPPQESRLRKAASGKPPQESRIGRPGLAPAIFAGRKPAGKCLPCNNPVRLHVKFPPQKPPL